MGAFSRSLITFSAFFIFCLCIGHADDNIIDPTWLKPGALDRWKQQQRNLPQPEGSCEGQVQPPVECSCPPPQEPPPAVVNNGITEDQKLAPAFYRKLVKTLFERDVLQLDPSGAFYNSALSLKVTSRQLDKLLDEVVSVREIDTMLAEVLEQSNSIRRKYVLQENRCERLYNFLLEFVASKLLQNMLPVVLLLVACFVVRIVARCTRIHPFIVFLLLILSITVLNKWRECNEELAKKSLQSERWSAAESSTLPVCDPLQVLVEATVSMQAVYFNAMFKQFLTAFKEHTENASFFQSMLIGLLLLGFAYVLLTTLLQVGISSGVQMFGNVVTAGLHLPRRAALAHNDDQAPQQPTVNLNIHIGEPSASAQPRTGLYRLESQRIEIVSDNQSSAAIVEKAVPRLEDAQQATKVKETERRKEDPKALKSTAEEEEGSDIEIIDG